MRKPKSFGSVRKLDPMFKDFLGCKKGDPCLRISCKKSSGGIKGGKFKGVFAPQLEALHPHLPPVKIKNGKNQPFSVNFWIFAPSMPPHKKNFWCRHCKKATH